MYKRQYLLDVMLVLLVMAALWQSSLQSQPVRDRILDDLDITETGAGLKVRISLTTRVRYVRHYPYDSGVELRIRVTPFDISSDNREALLRRESLVPFGDSPLSPIEVVYEGDIEGGPYLTLLFKHAVDFEVEQGRDSRSIVVHVSAAAPENKPSPATSPTAVQ
jgi:hypothetical protein